ncbi:MAG TPA: SusC/RagA family TonB-linked outer membrane protein [Chitinophagaceae bacterium]|jgi:TonB-linked SusC/RagA family outer membrane protein|nr:SusC/RagA family TonB-linked outer membrane protein [Chitinophagaceae bacterium]
MRKLASLLAVLSLFGTLAFSQNPRKITGQVKDESGPVAFATVTETNSNNSVTSDINGNFTITIKGNQITITAVDHAAQTVTVTGDVANVTLARLGGQLQEVVVTALGIRRTRNQVPYAAQQIPGDEVSKNRGSNFVTNLSGKISGLDIKQTNTMGGSTNVLIRGFKSVTGDNQALFVVDGVPFNNANTNTTNQRTGRGGFDYGNAAADINPDDIESITVLKGAAASALYGSQGANGVILITTKKGSRGLGITVNTGVGVGAIDKKTFVKYQKDYGGGYGAYYEDPSGFFLYRDVNGDGAKDLVVPMSEDASYGGKFDPSKMVYQWDAFDTSSPNFGKARPWAAAANDPSKFFEKPISYNTSIFIDGGSDKGTFKLGYTRTSDEGILPFSSVNKNLVNFAGTLNVTNKLAAGASVNFSNIVGRGRYGTGYDDKNMMTNFRQWWEVNVDVKEQKEAYFRHRQNVTWNWADPTDLVPIYWDNVYFSRYENYESDNRNRYFGNVNLSYKLTDWLNVLGRISLDSYDELQEERQAVGSVTTSNYTRFNRAYRETNYDLLFNVNKDLSSEVNFKALLGGNIRRQHTSSIRATTNGGLIIPRLYSLSNSVNTPNAPVEFDGTREVDGVFAGATISWRDMLTLDATVRRDVSSTLPKDNNAYYYPSVSGGFVFSKLLPSTTWLSYGKLRANYAEVGNDAPLFSVSDVYTIIPPFGSNSQVSVAGTKNNPDLKPERTKSWEAGLEMAFYKNRLGFDLSYYNARSFDQILPVIVSTATGYNSKFLNAATVDNKGVELSLFGTPYKKGSFSWDVNINWARNRNKVVKLFEGSENVVLANFQGGITLNATLGKPYGTIRGTSFVYDSASGQPIVGSNGRYLISPTSNVVIGDPNPDWVGGINNTFKYKNVSLSFLIDTRQGGDVFSLDLYYGMGSGLYPETADLNDKGMPSRNSIANGGGVILPGVKQDGKPNDIRVSNVNYGTFGGYGPRAIPAKHFVYDASFVKLREAILSYSIPKETMTRLRPFKGIDVSLIGRNLWIIHKNLPYADPEETISAGNLQGYQGGAYPSVRNFTLNLKLRF